MASFCTISMPALEKKRYLWGWGAAQRDAFLKIQFAGQTAQYAGYENTDHQIVESNGVSVGRLFLDRPPQEITLVDISLLSEFRNTGIGTFLIGKLLTQAKESCVPVRLHVRQANPAIHLYQRLGFSIIDDGFYLHMEWLPSEAV